MDEVRNISNLDPKRTHKRRQVKTRKTDYVAKAKETRKQEQLAAWVARGSQVRGLKSRLKG